MAIWAFKDISPKLERFVRRDLERILEFTTMPDTVLEVDWGKLREGSMHKHSIKIQPSEGKIVKIDIKVPHDYAYRGFSIENVNSRGLTVYYNRNKYEIKYGAK